MKVMKKQMIAIIALMLLTFILVKSHADISASLITECVGKVYGTSGCPSFQSSSSSVPATCGNSIVDAHEECDTGRFNGVTSCSTSCTFLVCGDGVVSAQVEEECEPTVQIVYALNEQTQQLTTEKKYSQNSCGVVCTVPVCTSGICTGGCTRKFLPACISSASSTISQAAQSQAAMNASSASIVSAAPAETSSETSATSLDSSSSVSSSEADVIPKSPLCGNAIVEGNEQCDDGAGNADLSDFLCRTDCTLARCGDVIIDGSRGERCDDGNGNANVAGALCRTNCALARCGDSIVDPSEECDNGMRNGIDGDLCSATCNELKPVTRLNAVSSVLSSEASVSSQSSDVSEASSDSSDDFLAPDVATTFESATPQNIPIAVGIAGICFLLFLAIIMRNDLRVLVTKVTGTIDDIPLDDIEMPK